MPTNEYRREVAARLRKNEPSSFGSLFDVLREIALAVNPNGGSYKTLPLELADLIEPGSERTCKWVWMELYNNITAINECEYAGWGLDCGCYDQPIDEIDDFEFYDTEEPPDIGWKYCPRCGAKVINNEN